MLKVELHTHTADDPVDSIAHTSTDLIDRAAMLGYEALAITLHEKQLDLRWLRPYAAERGIVLIPGVERTIEGCHVLLLNFPAAAVEIDTFDELSRLRRRHRGLVVAPHPFFPASNCLGRRLEQHAELFDAVECNAMRTRWLDFNHAARRWAARHCKPVVGNGDVHLLRQLGTTWSLVDAEPHPDAICQAILDGRVQVETRPLGVIEAAGILAEMTLNKLALAAKSSRPLVQPQ
jgi:predicted metal-dependent phosphoesterase TrpH